MSMSADSVFSSDRPRDPSIEFTRSMEAIPGANFKDELARKLHGRRSDDDEGFPSSPPAHTTTVDALIENGLKEKSMSMDSEHSLMSMDSSELEVEEDFFRKDWASGSTSHLAESPSNPNEYDLDVVVSTTSLNIEAAKHKIAVKPKSKARTSAHVQRRKTASPKPPGGVMVLPKLKEENPPAATTMDFEEDADTSQEKLDSTDDEIEVDIHEQEPKSEVSDRDIDTKSDVEDQEMEMSFSDKTGISSEDDDAKDSPRDVVSPPKPEDKNVVVLRRRLSPDKVERDSTKRQTIAVETSTTESTPFGERKVKRSSLIIERNWEQLGKPKDKVEEEPEVRSSSEFASVFAKFKKQSSTKTPDVDKKADSLENKRGSAIFGADKQKVPVTKKITNSGSVTVGFTPQAKETKVTVPAKDRTSVTKPADVPKNKVVTDKSKVVTDRNKVVSDKSKVVSDKSRVVSDKSKVVSDKSKVVSDKSKVVSEDKLPAKVVIIEKKETITVNKSLSKKSNDVEKDSVSNVVRREKVKEESKRDSDPKPSVEVTSKRTSGDKIVSKRISGESGEKATNDVKRTSGEVIKVSKDSEPKRNSGENKGESSAKRPSAVSAHTSAESENKTVVSKVSSKFVSVHSKSVALNDVKKSDTVAKATSHKTEVTGASSKAEKKHETKSVQISAADKSAVSGTNNLNVDPSVESFKRDSPRIANRLRSQTLPESAAIKNSISPGDSPSIKRANSHDDGVNKENIPASSDETSPKRSAAVLRSAGSARPAPQKLTGGGKPNWIEMARKRTEGWNEDKDKELESKKGSEGENADKRASSVLDLMKRFQ